MVALLEAKAASMPAAAKATIAPAVLQSYVGRWFLEPSYQWGHSSSPIMYKDTAIVQADQQKGYFIAAYDLKTGKEVWRTGREDEILTAYEGKTVERFYRSRVGGGGAFTASPVAADGKLYLANEDGEVDVVKAGRTFQEITKNEMKDVIMSTPAISGEVLILRTLGHVYGLVEKDQRQQSAHADTIALRPSTRPRYVIARLVLLEDIRRREHRSVGLRRPAPAVIHRCSVSHATVSPRAT